MFIKKLLKGKFKEFIKRKEELMLLINFMGIYFCQIFFFYLFVNFLNNHRTADENIEEEGKEQENQ